VRVALVSCFVDPLDREPGALLEEWPTLRLVAAAAARAGADVTVIQAAGRDFETERDGVAFAFVRETAPSAVRRRLGPWSWRPPGRLAQRVAAARPDVLHVHGLAFARQAGRLAHPLPGIPLLAQDHADHPPQRWKRGWLRAGFRRMTGIAFTAEEQAAPFRDAGLLRPPTRVFTVPESSSTFVPGDAAAARAATGIDGDPCLLWLGRLDGNKDPLTVLEALALTADSLPRARLWCCYGAAPQLDTVRARVEGDPALRGRVQLLGEQPHARVQILLRAADFLVQASRSEGSGFAVLEAMACGTTPLVTNIPAFRALTDGGTFGALATPGDAHGMARAWIDWAARPRARLRSDVRAHFERELSYDAIGRRLLSIYQALLP
jgi:glycosyltransferase involved in cell wall biosynthesis